jgi:hypothetical protein
MTTIHNLYQQLLNKLTQTPNEVYNKIMYFINEQNYKELNLFLKKEKPDLNNKMDAQMCLLAYCVCQRNIEAIKVLVKHGANVNYYDLTPPENFECYPILENSFRHTKILKFLLKSGMEVNNDVGQKALEKALQMSDSKMALLLMKHGAPYEKINIDDLPSYAKSCSPKLFADFTIEKEKLLLENTLKPQEMKLKAKL